MVCDYSLEYMGGAQSVFVDEAELFGSSGDDVLVIAPRPRRLQPPPAPGSTVFISASGTIPGVGLPIIRNTRRLRAHLRRVFEERRIEVVHVHSEFGLTAAATVVAHDLGIPVVHTVHTFFWQGPHLGRLDRAAAALVRGMARMLRGEAPAVQASASRELDRALRSITLAAAMSADAVVSPSAHQAVALREDGAKGVVVVPNPMRTARTTGVPLRSVDGPLRIVWVGRIAREKRVLEFLEAVVRAGGELSPHALDVTVVGEGPELAAARDIARDASPDRGCVIRFTGRVDRDEVERLIGQSHLVALTSFGFDNQPVVVVEAFAAARSVFYVDPRLQEGLSEAGILSESPDVEGMARTLIDVARDPRIVVERSALTVPASRQFLPEVHVQAVRDVWTSAASAATART